MVSSCEKNPSLACACGYCLDPVFWWKKSKEGKVEEEKEEEEKKDKEIGNGVVEIMNKKRDN